MTEHQDIPQMILESRKARGGVKRMRAIYAVKVAFAGDPNEWDDEQWAEWNEMVDIADELEAQA